MKGRVILLVAVLAALGIVWTVGHSGSRAPDCAADDASRMPAGEVAGYSGDQLVNAAAIMATAESRGLSTHAELLGVMAAMGESSLRVLPYGDYEASGVLNPDGTPTTSIGLFQQQDWWGSEEQRMDPVQSATLFFDRVVQVDGWEVRPASQVIHEVQVNSDPGHYASYQRAAEQVTAAVRACR